MFLLQRILPEISTVGHHIQSKWSSILDHFPEYFTTEGRLINITTNTTQNIPSIYCTQHRIMVYCRCRMIHFILLNILVISSSALQVAVIGTTGKLGRKTIQLLSQNNISCKCLLRHNLVQNSTSITEDSSAQVASYLNSLPNVQMIPGDLQDVKSLTNLFQDCDAVLSLQGPSRPNPIKSLLPFLVKQEDPNHGYMVNYIGTKNIIDAVKQTKSVKRIVRITGKNEQPFNIFAILINMLGYMAKGWNYESEALLRQSGLDYTIIRPGIMVDDDTIGLKNKGLKDNGQDMKVTKVSYLQIAQLVMGCLNYENCNKSTLTAMNKVVAGRDVDPEEKEEDNGGIEDYATLLSLVKPDSRDFPSSLIGLHKWGARFGFSVLILFCVGVMKGFMGILSLFL